MTTVIVVPTPAQTVVAEIRDVETAELVYTETVVVATPPTVTVVETATGPQGPQGPAGASGLANPMTTTGDLIVGGASGAPARLAIGTSSTVLRGGTTPAYATIPTVLGYTPLNQAGDTMTGELIVGSGQSLLASTPVRLSVLHGSFASPVVVAQPTVKITRVEQVSAATQPNLANNDLNAALDVVSQATGASAVQVCAGNFGAFGGGPAPGGDVCGVNAFAQILNSGSVGIAAAIYAQGRRDYDTGYAFGAEIRCSNQTTTAGVWLNNQASKTAGIWLTCDGLADSAAAIQVGALDTATAKWKVGLGFNISAIADAAILDESSATNSIKILGDHVDTVLVGGTWTGAGLKLNGFGQDVYGVDCSPVINISASGGGKGALNVAPLFVPVQAVGGDIYGLRVVPSLNGTDGVTTPTLAGIVDFMGALTTEANYDAAIDHVMLFAAQIISHNGAGTINTCYGFYSALNTGVARVTNTWQFYAGGNAPSYFGGNVQIADKDIILGTTTGTKIGTATSQKLGLFNVTPVIQPAAAAQAAAPAGGAGTAAGGWDTAANRDAAIATINAIRTALVSLGIIKGSA